MPGKRESIRLTGYDYTQQGAYYVTICLNNRKCLFGDVCNGEMVLNECGKIIDKCWNKIPEHFPHIQLDEYIVMPNHVHGVINIVEKYKINNVGAPLMGALNNDDILITNNRAAIKAAPTLGGIIGAFKSITTNEYIKNVKINNWPLFNKCLWQRNYYEHIIRNDSELNRIRQYIIDNPANWEEDRYL